MTNVEIGTISLNPIVRGCESYYSFIFPYSLVGYIFEGRVIDNNDNLITDFTITVDTGTNKVTLSLTHLQTILLSKGTYFWQLFQTDNIPSKNLVLKGLVEII